MAPRLATLDGKTVYLVDTGFHGCGRAARAGRWLVQPQQAERHDGFPPQGWARTPKTIRKLWAEIKEKGNAVIMAVGH